LSGDAVKVLSRVSDLVPVGELHTDDHVSDVHEGKAVGDVQLIEQSRLARPQFQLNNGNDGRAHGQSPNSLVSDPTGIAADTKFDCRVFFGGGAAAESNVTKFSAKELLHMLGKWLEPASEIKLN